ncbi:MAG TPA: response regulator [Chthonomonadaceae bacterium]|nr:response regulator [Chthonomonadaceae bacterium]
MDEPVRILIIDDDTLDRMAVIRALRAAGFRLEAQEASGGAEGLEALRRQEFDCAFLDYQLPDADGLAVLRQARAAAIQTPIVFLTGHGDEQIAVELMREGAADYLAKSHLSPETLGHTLRRILRLSRAERQARRAEAALRETESRFRIMADSAPVLLWMSDSQGRCTFLNESWLKFTGRALDQELGEGWRETLHPEDLPLVISAYQQALRTRQGYQIEYRLRHADGRYRWLLSSAAPRFLPEGQFTGFIGSCIDITERKETEAAQLRAQREIESLNERLQRAMTETHHRVKNSLQIVAAMVDMQRMEEDNAQRAESLKQLSMHIHTLAVVHDLLTEQAKQDGLAQSVSAQAILERLLPALQNMAGSREIRFSLEEARLSSQQGTSLALVANELVNNALKYGQGDVEVRLCTEASQVRLEVRDHGPGFPPGFEPDRAANTGLELVQNLVRSDLSGRVRFANAPEGGACVTVTFPIK